MDTIIDELNTLSVYTNEFGKKSNEKSYEELDEELYEELDEELYEKIMKIAELINCSDKTVSRNKSRLVRRLSIKLYGADALNG